MFTIFNENRRRGRPSDGVESKTRIRATRLEKSLDNEFMYACNIMGLSPTDGLRQAVILFVKEFAKGYRTR